MGKTEKIVVLSVLFAVVVLFVWSLQGPEARAAAAGGQEASSEPQGAAEVFHRIEPEDRRPVIEMEPAPGLGGDLGASDTVAAGDGGAPQGGTGMLSSLVVTPEVEPVPAVRLQSGWDLVTAEGLEPTVDPMMMMLRPEEGATWASLAIELYGDEGRTRLLRHYNEGMQVPGALVLVPAIDDLGPEPVNRKVEVLDGESLWLVAERTLGSGARWKEIFDLNRDVISDASKVRPGMVLTVPAAD